MIGPENIQQVTVASHVRIILHLHSLCVIPKASIGWIFSASSSKPNPGPDNSLSTGQQGTGCLYYYCWINNICACLPAQIIKKQYCQAQSMSMLPLELLPRGSTRHTPRTQTPCLGTVVGAGLAANSVPARLWTTSPQAAACSRRAQQCQKCSKLPGCSAVAK